MTQRRKVLLGTTLTSLLCICLVSIYLTTMSPLEALSSPFRWLVTVRDVPTILHMMADVRSVDPSRLADTLKRLAAQQGLTPDGDDNDPRDPHFVDSSLNDGRGNALTLDKTSGDNRIVAHYYATVFHHEDGRDTGTNLVLAVKQALIPLGFQEKK